MQKSIFRRYLTMTMIIILLSFIMLGSVIMAFFGRYWRQEKKEQLTQNASFVANVAGKLLSKSTDGGYELQADVLRGVISGFPAGNDTDVFVTDLEGQVLLGNRLDGQESGPSKAPEQAVALAAKGMYEARSSLGGLCPGRYYVIGVPLYDQAGSCAGAVFAAASPRAMNSFQGDMFKIFLVASAAVLAVTFCLVGAFAYRMVKPLRQMSSAARSFGAGDFSVRVPVTSADELGQLAVSFNNMANSLSNSEGTRRSFIANVSHELKTPMTTIAGFIDGILDGTIPREEQDKYLTIVSSEIKRLSRLVKSMLDLSRIDNGDMKIHPARFDLTNTVVTTLLTFEQSIDQKQIEVRGLEDARPLNIYGDPDLLHQVVYNLIENAVKFTNPGGWISVQLTDGIDRTTAVIQNSGQGIPPEELPMIFERFYKTDKSRSQDKNGMGLGLYIVRTILKLHGGDITVSSTVGEFCRFEFYIPKPQEAPKLKENPPPRLKEPKAREGKAKEPKSEKGQKNSPERSKDHD